MSAEGSRYGMLTAIGVGPGDPELITLKGLRLLREAAVVFVPLRRSAGASFALEIAGQYLDRARQEIVPLLYAMAREERPDPECWRANAREIAVRLRDGKDGAFLTEGDPLLYSTFIPTLEALRADWPQLPVRVVPGVSSMSAAAALGRQPLGRLEERLAIVPATSSDAALRAALREYETVVILKVAARFERVLELLEETGRTHGTLLAERVGTDRERLVTDLSTLGGTRPDYFSLVIAHGG